MVRNVTHNTTITVASVSAYFSVIVYFKKNGASILLNLSSANTPTKIEINVMPIVAVLKNFSGLLASSSAALALSSPFAAIDSKRPLRALTNAISLITKRPVSSIKSNSIKTSNMCIDYVKKNLLLKDVAHKYPKR